MALQAQRKGAQLARSAGVLQVLWDSEVVYAPSFRSGESTYSTRLRAPLSVEMSIGAHTATSTGKLGCRALERYLLNVRACAIL